MEDMHTVWYLQAVEALLGAYGRKLYRAMDRRNQSAFVFCLSRIEEEMDIRSGARCITAAVDGRLQPSPFRPMRRAAWKPRRTIRRRPRPLRRKDIRMKEPFAIRILKQKTAKGRPKRDYRLTSKNSYDDESSVKTLQEMPGLKDTKQGNPKSPVTMLAKFLTNVVRSVDPRNRMESKATWEDSQKRIHKMERMIERSGDRFNFKRRMLDVVTGMKRRRTVAEKVRDLLPTNRSPLMSDVFKLVESYSKHNGEVNYRFLSPKFGSVLPPRHSHRTESVFSPNVLPFYRDPNSVLPIPDIVEATGLPSGDQKAVLELIMEASGARLVVDEASKVFEKAASGGFLEDILNITNAITNTFQSIERTFSSEQRSQMDTDDFTFLTAEQLKEMFASGGVFNVSDLPFDLEDYAKWKDEEREEAVIEKIRSLAEEGDGRSSRSKRQITLSPFAFSPTKLDLAVLAPMTLSPNIFSPIILAPGVLSPPVFTPMVGSPLVFAPFILGPNVFSAAVFDVYVFSPYFISPNVFNPYVLSPLILSPHMLSPDVVSHTVLSGTILNPFFLSPPIGTESALAADILSPSFLSKR
ncbi:hypothetical protein QR680_013460 [Steinernema hermaphroditum]|uniref:Uncharacterized protein n=1 Tax=Steinernema hermaphroditum TaxID=289476 RepID=A0AA39I755_9BILA|nr:hypothetical protein QR680_013460 [Steinernema hermaphroditum]